MKIGRKVGPRMQFFFFFWGGGFSCPELICFELLEGANSDGFCLETVEG